MRKFIGMLVLITFIGVYAAGAATVGTMLIDQPRLVQLLYYVVAGVAWALPLKPLFAWINGGKKAQG